MVLDGLLVGAGAGEDDEDEEDEDSAGGEYGGGDGFPATPAGGVGAWGTGVLGEGAARLGEGFVGQRLAARRRGEDATSRAAKSLSWAAAASP